MTQNAIPVQPVGSGSVEAVVAQLEEDIVLGRRHPRERLLEEDLCAKFHLTRHKVRQVLDVLEKYRLVESRKNVGAFVRAYTPQEVKDLYQVRDILETGAARLIRFPVSHDRLAEIIEIQNEHDRCAESGDLCGVFQANLAFHEAVFALTNNASLCSAIKESARSTHSIRFQSARSPELLALARKEHWLIIKALETENLPELVATCRSHLLPSMNFYLKNEVMND